MHSRTPCQPGCLIVLSRERHLDLADTTSALAKKEAADVKVPTAKAAIDANDDADIEMIFERMKQQRAEEERRKALKKEEESSDEEDEDFEDVVGPGTNSAGGTPASLSAAPPAKTSLAPSPLRQSSLKREASSGSGFPPSALRHMMTDPPRRSRWKSRPRRTMRAMTRLSSRMSRRGAWRPRPIRPLEMLAYST